jgi:hypothetical protein
MNKIIQPLGALVAIACLSSTAARSAEDATCKLVLDALAKSVMTPNHQYTTVRMAGLKGGEPQNTEIISTGKAAYIQHEGKWKPSVSPQAMLDQMNENRNSTITSCHFVRDESIDGVSAGLYTVHEDNGDSGSVDSKVWLAKANGLVAHMAVDLDEMHSESRYVYGAVSAPPVN